MNEKPSLDKNSAFSLIWEQCSCPNAMVSGRRWQKREDLKFKMMAPWGSSNMKPIGSQEMPRPTLGHDEGVVYLKGTGRGWCTGKQMYHSAREPGYALGQPLCIWEPVHCKARPT